MSRVEKITKNNWYAVSGGPSSGKTTLINELGKLGYRTVPEAVRPLIEAEIAKGRRLEEIQHTDELQRKVLAAQLAKEKAAPTGEVVFFDRGIPDTYIYSKVDNLDLSIYSGIELRGRYKKVFFCELLPLVKDLARVEDEVRAKMLSEALLNGYREFGYDVMVLAATSSVQDRIKTVLVQIRNG
ncbi:MAG: ATP-binding protein [Candidatus Pacebacteria bacterium]|nr:ATP-binding protein [Candidatus Paceibacterota bacterium]